MPATNTKGHLTVVRSSIDEFCQEMDIKQADLAKILKVTRQQITNWKRAAATYFIDHNTETGSVTLVIGEYAIKKGKFKRICQECKKPASKSALMLGKYICEKCVNKAHKKIGSRCD